MQYADLEQLVLSGELFNGGERSTSPVRTPSPDAGWHDDEFNKSNASSDGSKTQDEPQQQSIGMKPGRTGVKGVIRDREESNAINRSKRALEIEQMNKKMESTSLGGKTFLEEEREKAAEKAKSQGEASADARIDVFGRPKDGRFGHLREVGAKGFLSAVEQEEKDVWIVVHIFDPSLERCYTLDETLSRLARLYPNTKFIHTRASTLGFASKSPSSRKPLSSNRITSRKDIDDDDPYGDDDEEEKAADEINEDDVDTDMLPTMLVYRDGDLVHNWVRVDWEAGAAGIEDLLFKNRVLPANGALLGNCGIPSDEDEDLLWSDDDDR